MVKEKTNLKTAKRKNLPNGAPVPLEGAQTPPTEEEQLDSLMQAYIARGETIARLTSENARLEKSVYILQKQLSNMAKQAEGESEVESPKETAKAEKAN